MPRLLTGLLGALILAAALLGAACSSSDSTGTASPTTSAAAGQTQAVTDAPTDKPTDKPTDAPTATPSNATSAVAGASAEFAHVRVTLNAMQDPASSGNQFIQPAAGKRYVAFDTTIEFFNDSGTHSVNPYNFSLSDAQSFAYNPTFGGPEPALALVDLHPGEKTRGWVMFEVTNGPLQRLRYQPNPLKDTYIEFNFP